jgi:hypothetical protein
MKPSTPRDTQTDTSDAKNEYNVSEMKPKRSPGRPPKNANKNPPKGVA